MSICGISWSDDEDFFIYKLLVSGIVCTDLESGDRREFPDMEESGVDCTGEVFILVGLPEGGEAPSNSCDCRVVGTVPTSDNCFFFYFLTS